MKFNWLYLGVLLRGLFLSGVAAAFLLLWPGHQQKFTLFFTGLCWLILLLEFSHYFYRTNKAYFRFLQMMKHGDTHSILPENFRFRWGQKFYEEMLAIRQDYHLIRKERQEQQLLFQYMLDRNPAGILAFDRQDGSLLFINKAAGKAIGLHLHQSIHELEALQPALYTALGQRKETHMRVNLVQNKRPTPYLIYTGTMKSADRLLAVVTLQNIEAELERQETEAYRKLIRVLRHEMLNSISPVHLLADSLLQGLRSPEFPRDKLQNGLQTIQRRAKNLQQFVKAYRSVTEVPAPQRREVLLKPLLESLRPFAGQHVETDMLRISCSPADARLFTDEKLLEQALVNLLKNAAEATYGQETRKIELAATQEAHTTRIAVTDNGIGIHAEDRETIFTPFFSTKTGGSGIGLPLSREIINKLGGRIALESAEGQGATFWVVFEEGRNSPT